MNAKRTATIFLFSIKDPDGWGDLIQELRLSREVTSAHFEFGEYANLELEIDKDLNVVGGRVLKLEDR